MLDLRICFCFFSVMSTRTYILKLLKAFARGYISSANPDTWSVVLADGLFAGRQQSRRDPSHHRQSRLACPMVSAWEVTEGILLELLASSADRQDVCASPLNVCIWSVAVGRKWHLAISIRVLDSQLWGDHAVICILVRFNYVNKHSSSA